MEADEEQTQRNQRSSIPSFLFVSFMLFMLTSRNGDEFLARHQYQDALVSLGEQLSNYTAWMNGSESNFTMPQKDPSALPLISQFLSLTGRPDPNWASYYSNISGFMHGDLVPHNITPPQLHNSGYRWEHQGLSYFGDTNMTEVFSRLGSWNWTATNKVSFSVVEKRHVKFDAPEDTLMLHGRIEFTDANHAEELRLDFEAIHFVPNGSIYGLAEPTGKHIDIRLLPSLVPPEHQRRAALVIVPELKARMDKVQGLIDAGLVDQDLTAPDETIKSTCPFTFYGQIRLNYIPQDDMVEFESELDQPTGITTVSTPKLSIQGVLSSKECGLLYEVNHVEGLRSRLFFRKVIAYAGIVGLAYLTLITLLSRQISRSQTPSGVSRVSRWTFLSQAVIDAISFAAHLTFAVLADGRPSLSLVAPAFLACVLFIQEAQFAFLIHQIQLPEDNIPNPSPAPLPQQAASAPSSTGDTPAQTPQPPQPPGAPSFFAGFWDHVRTDPQARLWLFLFFFLTFVVRVVLSPTLALLFVSTTYSCFWLPQIIRSAIKGRSSGFSIEYVIGTTACRLGILLYFLACPENVLDVEPRSWAHILAAFILFQVSVLLLQGVLGPSFFIPQRYSTGPGYDYHPPMPLPDPESPDQSLGDCAICMDAILVDPTARQKDEDAQPGLLRMMRRSSNVRRQTWSLAPCHHLFHTECLEKWLAIKNICPHCRRPLPPL